MPTDSYFALLIIRPNLQYDFTSLIYLFQINMSSRCTSIEEDESCKRMRSSNIREHHRCRYRTTPPTQKMKSARHCDKYHSFHIIIDFSETICVYVRQTRSTEIVRLVHVRNCILHRILASSCGLSAPRISRARHEILSPK